MTAPNPSTSPANAPQPIPGNDTPKRNGRPRKYPEGVKAHLKAVKAEKRAQQAAQAATVAPASQSLAAQAPQTVQNAPRPLPPYLQAVSPYPTNEMVESEIVSGGFVLTELGASCAHATGFLSALLEHLTHSEAFDVCGFRWGVVANWEQLSPGFRDLYSVCLRKLDALRVQVLKDAAFKRATVGQGRGVYWDGKKIATEYYPSDKMHELMLRGLDPATFGKLDSEGSQQAVQVNITL